MTLSPGTRLGAYEIVAPLGAGGMGEVYRARDPKLDREVAIKVLPGHLTGSLDARSRFEREAKAVAALSHPNILAVYDFGEEGGAAYVVTELLEGETLNDRLNAGPIPVRKTVELARQMAEGMAAAHEKGIVHRDLKPANVFLTPDGRIKILDFGLAKTGVSDAAHTQAATIGESTDPGTVLGTVGYMSPEQVRADPVDHRSDIFSFGSVLYEMLSARRAFARDSAVETMSAILREDPRDVSSINPAVPLSLDRILQRCLEKKPEERFQSARDLAFALGNTPDSSSRSRPAIEAPRKGTALRVRALLAGLALFVLGGLAGALLFGGAGSPETPEPVKVMPLTHTGKDWAPSASPDGRMLAFISGRDGVERIWVRQMQGGIEAPLTEGVDVAPEFSPDGSSILFLRDEGPKYSAYRVPVVGGQSRKVLDGVLDATWSPDGTRIGFVRPVGKAEDAEQVVGILDIRTGETRELVRLADRFLYGMRWSPDGKWISASGSSAVLNTTENDILLIDADTGEMRKALTRPVRISAAAWDPSGESLVFAESTSLLGDISSPIGRVLRLDLASGRERTLFWVQSVYAGGGDYVEFDFLKGHGIVFDEIIWRGSLTEIELAGEPPYEGERSITHGNSRDRQPAYSPDGERIIFSSNRSGNLDLWTLNTGTGDVRQLTDDAAEDWDPAYSRDGQSILWSSNRSGHLEIWIARADGSGARQLTDDGEDAENPTQMPDGEWIVYGSGNPDRNGIWKIRTDGSEEVQLASGPGFIPEVSPDGRFASYVVNDPGKDQARIQVVDTESAENVFTTEVGFMGFQSMISPGRTRWMPDGGSLVFVAPDSSGRTGLYRQAFRPGEDTSATRVEIVGFEEDRDVESFGISPDGSRLTVSRIEHFRTVKLAEGIPGSE